MGDSEKSAVDLTIDPLEVHHFSSDAFHIFSLSLMFYKFTTMCLSIIFLLFLLLIPRA